MNKKNILLGLRIIVAAILIQTLRFKFTAHPDSVYIFETLGIETFGRIGIGIIELITGALLLFSKSAPIGGILSIGLMAGAIFSHLTQLGIEVKGDGGVLFYTAVITFLLSAVITFNYKKELLIVGQYL